MLVEVFGVLESTLGLIVVGTDGGGPSGLTVPEGTS